MTHQYALVPDILLSLPSMEEDTAVFHGSQPPDTAVVSWNFERLPYQEMLRDSKALFNNQTIFLSCTGCT